MGISANRLHRCNISKITMWKLDIDHYFITLHTYYLLQTAGIITKASLYDTIYSVISAESYHRYNIVIDFTRPDATNIAPTIICLRENILHTAGMTLSLLQLSHTLKKADAFREDAADTADFAEKLWRQKTYYLLVVYTWTGRPQHCIKNYDRPYIRNIILLYYIDGYLYLH